MTITAASGLQYTGFESISEFLTLVLEAKIDPRFQTWKANDRTKAGLLALGKRPDVKSAFV